MLRDMEELAEGGCAVESWGCLGRCGKGPNIEVVEEGGRPRVLTGVKTFKKACEVLEEVGVDISSMAKKSGKQKFEIRRETDAEKRVKKLGEAFKTLGGDAGAKKYPPLYAALLMMRAKEAQNSRAKGASAVEDTQMALKLVPNSAQAYIAHATALEAAARVSEGLEILDKLLSSGMKGFNVQQVNRQKFRLERKVQDEAAEKEKALPEEVGAAAEAEAEPKAADAKAKPAAKAKPKAKAEPSPPKVADANAKPQGKAEARATKEGPTASDAKAKAKGAVKRKAKPAAKDGPPTAKGAKPAATDAKPARDVPEPAPEKMPKDGRESIRIRRIMEDPPAFFDWRIDSVKELSSDCIELKLTCPDPVVPRAQWAMVSDGLHATWHVDLCIDGDAPGEPSTIRPYTPISDIESFKQGRLDIMLKVYPFGIMTQHIASLPVGEGIGVSGPVSTLDPGEFSGGLAMVAGGSAVTIALQLCETVLQINPGVPVSLFLCFRTVDDAHYTEYFDRLSEASPSFERVYCISSGLLPGSGLPASGRVRWHEGRLNASLLSAVKPGCRSVLSGPPGLLFAARKMLLGNGHEADDILLLDDAEESPEPQEEPRLPQLSEVALQRRPAASPPDPPPLEEVATLQSIPALQRRPAPKPAPNPGFLEAFLRGLQCCSGPHVAPDDVPDEAPTPVS